MIAVEMFKIELVIMFNFCRQFDAFILHMKNVDAIMNALHPREHMDIGVLNNEVYQMPLRDRQDV